MILRDKCDSNRKDSDQSDQLIGSLRKQLAEMESKLQESQKYVLSTTQVQINFMLALDQHF
jgi:hypothetical protein